MKKNFSFIIIVVVLSALGCSGVDRKAFQLYKQKQKEPLQVRLDGFYKAVGDYPGHDSIFFYADGTFWGANVFTRTRYISGVYRIKGDTIYMQSFEYNDAYRTVANEIGIKFDGNKIALLSWECKWCIYDYPYPPGKHVFNAPQVFEFVNNPAQKQDSTDMWFKERKWYRRYLNK